MTLTDMLGWFAAGLVFATFCARQMAPLRALAIVSNLAFIGYGYLDHLLPIVILHVAMLPTNVIRLRQALSAGGIAVGRRNDIPAAPGRVTCVADLGLMRLAEVREPVVRGVHNVRRHAVARSSQTSEREGSGVEAVVLGTRSTIARRDNRIAPS
jgi:hypothetical protein